MIRIICDRCGAEFKQKPVFTKNNIRHEINYITLINSCGDAVISADLCHNCLRLIAKEIRFPGEYKITKE